MDIITGRNKDTGVDKITTIDVLSTGSYIGEYSMIMDVKNPFTCKALTNC